MHMNYESNPFPAISITTLYGSPSGQVTHPHSRRSSWSFANLNRFPQGRWRIPKSLGYPEIIQVMESWITLTLKRPLKTTMVMTGNPPSHSRNPSPEDRSHQRRAALAPGHPLFADRFRTTESLGKYPLVMTTSLPLKMAMYGEFSYP